MESILWESAVKEEGSLLDGGNPKEWDPWRGSSHFFKRRARHPLFLMHVIIDFCLLRHVCNSSFVAESLCCLEQGFHVSESFSLLEKPLDGVFLIFLTSRLEAKHPPPGQRYCNNNIMLCCRVLQ